MPGIDFSAVRAQVSIGDVLMLLEFRVVRRRRTSLRGVCPFGCSRATLVFEAYLDTDRYYCHRCGRSGNQLDLWTRLRHLTVYDAAEDLCHRLHLEIPYIYRW